jgi:hypothetical protein
MLDSGRVRKRACSRIATTISIGMDPKANSRGVACLAPGNEYTKHLMKILVWKPKFVSFITPGVSKSVKLPTI